ncbi:MAG: hypothetical protein HY360_11765 [Verrucomicrobia bacterium]|nr:hypothetical protein [Verrucomicrobiota bacterium]
MNKLILHLPTSWTGACFALTSLPWPAGCDDLPQAVDVPSQTVRLFDPHTRPRRRRYLLLCASDKGLPADLEVRGGARVAEPEGHFSEVTIRILNENLTKYEYVYRECEARLHLNSREIGLRMGLLPTNQKSEIENQKFSWWQWSRAERLWAGSLAEAWRIGGHLVPCTTDATGFWENSGLQTMGEQIAQKCGDVLHGDLFLIVWKSGCIQVTAHFKAGYFHYWPKPIPAFPVIFLSGVPEAAIDMTPSNLVFAKQYPLKKWTTEGSLALQPWQDLRVLANKTKDNHSVYLDPAQPEVIPPGVSRSFWFNIGLAGAPTRVARYLVPPAWYQSCGEIECNHAGTAAAMASRSVALIKEHTQKGGFDTGRVWRYLRRDLRSGQPQEDGAEWEGNLAQAMFTFAYQRGEDPSAAWELYLQHAYHAADISIYHGSWMGRLECCTVFTAPLPKFRFGGMVYGYLETGDPYLLEAARSVAGVYMAMEWAHEPRFAIGRDAYPLTCLMSLWDYTAEPLYLDFARQTALRLLATQHDDGGFSGQAGAGIFSGLSSKPAVESIGFGSGLLAPLAFLEWAIRDHRWPQDFIPRLRKWADLMLRAQPPNGVWLNGGSTGTPYPLIGSAALLSLVKAGQILHDNRCTEAVGRFLSTMNDKKNCVSGTHSFLSALYAHVADAALENCPPAPVCNDQNGTGNHK